MKVLRHITNPRNLEDLPLKAVILGLAEGEVNLERRFTGRRTIAQV